MMLILSCNVLGISVWCTAAWRVVSRGRNMGQGVGDLFQCFAEVLQQFLTRRSCGRCGSAGLEPMHARTGVRALLPLMGPDLSCVPTATAKQSHSSFSAAHAD